MDKDRLILKRSSVEWNDDNYYVFADGAVVGRIFKANAAPVGTPWMWTPGLRPSRGSHADARL